MTERWETWYKHGTEEQSAIGQCNTLGMHTRCVMVVVDKTSVCSVSLWIIKNASLLILFAPCFIVVSSASGSDEGEFTRRQGKVWGRWLHLVGSHSLLMIVTLPFPFLFHLLSISVSICASLLDNSNKLKVTKSKPCVWCKQWQKERVMQLWVIVGNEEREDNPSWRQYEHHLEGAHVCHAYHPRHVQSRYC